MPDAILWTCLILAPVLTFLLVGALLVEIGWPRVRTWLWLRLRRWRWTREDWALHRRWTRRS